jgi:hypothetical protein
MYFELQQLVFDARAPYGFTLHMLLDANDHDGDYDEGVAKVKHSLARWM